MTVPRSLRLLPLVVLAACSSGGDTASSAATGATGGTVVISTPGKPDNFLPPITTATSGMMVNDLVYQKLATMGDALNTVGDEGFVPDLATRWSWSADSLSLTFALDPAARWHDGAPVRAADVAFSFALYMDSVTASPLAPLLANIDSVIARDSLTVVAFFHQRRPDQFFGLVQQLYVVPQHLLANADRARLAASPLASAPVGSGPFRVARWVPDQVLELAADTTAGRRRAQLDRVMFTFAPDPATAFERVVTGEADVFEAVRPDKVAEVQANKALRLVVAPSLDYNFLGFNLVDASGRAPHPIFGDRTVRRALTMATDRRSIVSNIYDTLGVQSRGPFTAAMSINDPALKPLPYAVDSANALLDAAGWVRGADSIRRKGGKPLSFGMMTPSTSVPRMRASVLLQEQFRRIGVEAKVETVDIPIFLERSTKRRYDAIVNQWALPDPAPANVNDAWTSASAVDGGHNFSSYRNPAFDAQVDSGLAAFAPAATRAHFAKAWRIIADDAPAIWIAEPMRVMAVHSRIQTAGVRAGAWWAGLSRWSIPADKRIARDVQAAGAAR
ncbi:MAG: ABC transporter substrate-binding protein [Gemmatimonadota bacterium]